MKTKNLPKKPIKGGIPAKESKQNTKNKLNKKFECVIETTSLKLHNLALEGYRLIITKIENIFKDKII